MIRNTLFILVNSIIVSIVFFFITNTMQTMASEDDYCFGPDCAYVTCEPHYMLEVRPTTYVRCEDLDAWVQAEDKYKFEYKVEAE